MPHHFRHDFFIVLSTNVDKTLLTSAVGKIAKKSPVPVEYCRGSGETPYEAYLNCGKKIEQHDSPAVIAHMDIVNSTSITTNNGPLEVYVEILEILNYLTRRCKEVGCLAFYLGGDNIMVFLPTVESIFEVLRDMRIKVRVGVGEAKKPYTAFVKATRGLDHLRSVNKIGVKVVK